MCTISWNKLEPIRTKQQKNNCGIGCISCLAANSETTFACFFSKPFKLAATPPPLTINNLYNIELAGGEAAVLLLHFWKALVENHSKLSPTASFDFRWLLSFSNSFLCRFAKLVLEQMINLFITVPDHCLPPHLQLGGVAKIGQTRWKKKWQSDRNGHWTGFNNISSNQLWQALKIGQFKTQWRR